MLAATRPKVTQGFSDVLSVSEVRKGMAIVKTSFSGDHGRAGSLQSVPFIDLIMTRGGVIQGEETLGLQKKVVKAWALPAGFLNWVNLFLRSS